MASPDPFGSGISWLAHPADTAGDEYRISVYVRPRLFGPDPSATAHPVALAIEHLFDNWPRTLGEIGDEKFKIEFFASAAAAGDAPIATAEATLVADAHWPQMQGCWNALFKGDGPHRSADAMRSGSGRLNLKIRATALAWDLAHEELRSKRDWARKAIPPTIHTYSSRFLHEQARQLEHDRQLQLFLGNTYQFQASGTRLESLALEAWTLPRRGRDVPDKDSNVRISKADRRALDHLVDAGNVLDRLRPPSQPGAALDPVHAHLKAALSALASPSALAPVSIPIDFASYFEADDHDAKHRGFSRVGITSDRVRTEAAKALDHVFAPPFYSLNLHSEPAGLSRRDLAAMTVLGRLQAEHVLSRTGRYERGETEQCSSDLPWKGKDFFERIALIEQYHGLLRPLGLILDLRFSWPDGVPDQGTIGIRPPTALLPDHAMGYRTAYRRQGKRFQPAPRRAQDGISILDGGRVPVGNSRAFALIAHDQDGEIMRAGLTADSLRDADYAEQQVTFTGAASRNADTAETGGVNVYLGSDLKSSGVAEKLHSRYEYLRTELEYRVKRLAGDIAFPGGTALVRFDAVIEQGVTEKQILPVYVRPLLAADRKLVGVSFVYGANGLATAQEIHAPQPRRGDGFVLGWIDKAQYLAERALRAVEHEASLATKQFTVFDEEDLLAGLMVEVRRLSIQVGGGYIAGPWQPLCWRKESYPWLDAGCMPFPITLAAQQDLDVAPGQLNAPKDLFTTPDLFRWQGGMLSITPDEPMLRSNDPADQVSCRDSWSTFDAPGPLPKLVYSRVTEAGYDRYEFRVRGIDQTGLYLDNRLSSTPRGSEEATDRLHHVSAPYLRSEPLPAPRVLMPFDAAREAHEAGAPAPVRETGTGAGGADPQGNALRRADFSRPRVAASSEAAPPSVVGWDRRSPATLVVSEDRGSDLRWIVPARVPIDFCDRYDLVGNPADVGSFDAVRLNSDSGDFYALGELDPNGDPIEPHADPGKSSGHPGPPVFLEPRGAITTPYFPDPAARSYAVEVRDETEAGISLGFDSARMFLIPLYPARRSWPQAVPFRIILRASKPKNPEAKLRAVWHGSDRRLVIELPPGRKALLRLSTSPSLSPDDVFSLRHFAEHAEMRETEPTMPLARWERWTAAGSNPRISSPLTLTLLHARREPVYRPEQRRLAVFRDRAELQSKTRLNYDIIADARSTAEIEIAAEWDELIDLPSEPEPRQVRRQVTADPIKVAEPAPPLVQIDTAMRGSSWLPRDDGFVRLASRPSTERFLPFQDTKHYRISCTANGKTRYGEHYRDPPLTRAHSDTFTIDVPNAAPPPPPVFSHVVPTFGWSTFSKKIDGGVAFSSKRAGGGLRVYFDRPHRVTGPGEKIAVLLVRPEGWASLPASLEMLATRWSSDPLHGDGNLGFSPRADDFLSGELHKFLTAPEYEPLSSPLPGQESQWCRNDLFTTVWPPDRMLPIKPIEWKEAKDGPLESLQLIAHDAEFDAGSGRWFVDIVTRLGSSSYFPFIRLCLLRFQPCSLRGCHLSTVTRLDYAQFVPDRTVTVSRHPSIRRAMRIIVSGPDRRGTASTTLTRQPPANSFYLQFFRSSDGASRGDEQIDVEQVDVEQHVSPQQGSAPGDPQILVEFIVRFPSLIGERRFAIVEKEVHDGDERTIFADVMDFKRQWPWS